MMELCAGSAVCGLRTAGTQQQCSSERSAVGSPEVTASSAELSSCMAAHQEAAAGLMAAVQVRGENGNLEEGQVLDFFAIRLSLSRQGQAS